MTLRVASGTVGSLSTASTGVSRGEGGEGGYFSLKKNASFRMRIEQAGRSHMEVTGGLEHPGRVNTSSPGLGGSEHGTLDGEGTGQGAPALRTAKLRSLKPPPLTCLLVTEGFENSLHCWR